MNRRNFLKIMSALIAAPAVVKADNIMKVSSKFILPSNNIILPLDAMSYTYHYADKNGVTISNKQPDYNSDFDWIAIFDRRLSTIEIEKIYNTYEKKTIIFNNKLPEI